MSKGKTLLSLNKREILNLPGFTELDDYLLRELKGFVRTRMHEYTTKKRGYTVEEYKNDYNKKPEPFTPKYPTQSKRVRERNAKPGTQQLLRNLGTLHGKHLLEEYRRKRKGQYIKLSKKNA